jgi:hypothetical protein
VAVLAVTAAPAAALEAGAEAADPRPARSSREPRIVDAVRGSRLVASGVESQVPAEAQRL